MTAVAGTGTAREFLVVIAVAFAGVLLALIAVFTPWYQHNAEPHRGVVVELHSPVVRQPAEPVVRAG